MGRGPCQFSAVWIERDSFRFYVEYVDGRMKRYRGRVCFLTSANTLDIAGRSGTCPQAEPGSGPWRKSRAGHLASRTFLSAKKCR